MQPPNAPISYQLGSSWQFSSCDWRPRFSWQRGHNSAYHTWLESL